MVSWIANLRESSVQCFYSGEIRLNFSLPKFIINPVVIGRTSNILGSHGLLPDFNLDDAVLIDDNPGNAFDNPKHFIQISSFFGEDDDELLRVLEHII